jgi:hypothetical protein
MHWKTQDSRSVANLKRRATYSAVAVVQSVRCPKCDQPPGQPCVGVCYPRRGFRPLKSTNGKHRPPHDVRIREWSSVGAPPRKLRMPAAPATPSTERAHDGGGQ